MLLATSSTWLFAQSRNDPLSFHPSDFDCRESVFEGGFESCEIQIDVSINIPREYWPYLDRYVDVDCVITIAYKEADGFSWNYAEDRTSTLMPLRHGKSFDSISLTVDFGFTFNPVILAELEHLACEAY